MDNKRYYIELEVLTPLSVGAGNENDWVCGVDYVLKGGKVYVIDTAKASRLGISADELASVFATSDQQAIIDLLGNRLERASSRIFDAPVPTSNPIKAFIRTQLMDKPVIPGSSIKGAVRSCLFNDFHGPRRDGENINEIKSNDINSQVFGTMKTGDVFTRFIHIGDVVMPQTQLVNTKIFNLQGDRDKKNWKGGWKHGGRKTTSEYQSTGFNTLYECVVPGMKGIGTIDMMNGAFEQQCQQANRQNYLDAKQRVMHGDLKALFHIINETTWNYLQKEIEFFDVYSKGAQRVKEIINAIDFILSKIPSDDSYCVMKMAAGSGFHSITGDWLYDDYYEMPGFRYDKKTGNFVKKYKSRKIAEFDRQLQMMGFVILRPINEDGELRYQEHLEKMRKMKE